MRRLITLLFASASLSGMTAHAAVDPAQCPSRLDGQYKMNSTMDSISVKKQIERDSITYTIGNERYQVDGRAHTGSAGQTYSATCDEGSLVITTTDTSSNRHGRVTIEYYNLHGDEASSDFLEKTTLLDHDEQVEGREMIHIAMRKRMPKHMPKECPILNGMFVQESNLEMRENGGDAELSDWKIKVTPLPGVGAEYHMYGGIRADGKMHENMLFPYQAVCAKNVVYFAAFDPEGKEMKHMYTLEKFTGDIDINNVRTAKAMFTDFNFAGFHSYKPVMLYPFAEID